MVVQITGCIDCPFFDATGSEYGIYCHHPKRKFRIEVSVEGDEKIDGSCIKKINVSEAEYEYYEKEAHRRSLLSIKEEEGLPWMSINIINEPIDDDENYNPVTPDWCPLQTEPIQIKAKFQLKL